jgi:transcriptional regulator with XRE-family HTH domain
VSRRGDVAVDGSDPAPDAAIVTALGTAIRAARASANLSMRALAALAGISQPFLSQVENGSATPSLITLYRIANALRISPTDLLPTVGAPQEVHVVRVGEGERVAVSEAPNSATTRLLSAGAGHDLVVSEYRIRPGEDLGDDWFTSEGDLTVYVVEGALEVQLEGHGSWVLTAGDSISHPGAIKNHWHVPGTRTAVVLLSFAPAGPRLLPGR